MFLVGKVVFHFQPSVPCVSGPIRPFASGEKEAVRTEAGEVPQHESLSCLQNPKMMASLQPDLHIGVTASGAEPQPLSQLPSWPELLFVALKRVIA